VPPRPAMHSSRMSTFPGPRPTEPARRTQRVWLTLILVMTLIEAALLLADRGLLGTPRWRPMLYAYGAFWPGLLQGWQPNYPGQPVTMFATYAFLHGSWQHLLGNAATLTWLGLVLGRRCRPRTFGFLYAVSALGGGIGYGLLAPSAAPMVGASGAIMGLVGAWIVWDSRDRITEGDTPRRALIAALWMTAVVAAFNLAMFLLLDGLVAWQAHLGGFLAGVVAGWVTEGE